MITSATTRGNLIRYSISTREGHLRGTFIRNQLNFRPIYNADFFGVNTSVENFKADMTAQEACNIYGNEVTCGCKGDCSTS
jgi:hypothetical protein